MAGYLQNKTAIVTGSGRGIGRGHALALAAEGAKVIVNDAGVERDGTGGAHTPADEVVAEIQQNGGIAVANYDSVADFQGAKNLIQCAVEQFGRVDILVNNAGIAREGLFHQVGSEDFDAIIGVHLKGSFNTCRHAVPVMMAQRYGRIINTASSQWRNPEGRAIYSTAKGAIVSLTWDLAFELRNHGITVNAIAPMGQTRAFNDYRHPDLLREAGIPARKAGDELTTDRPGGEHVSPLVAYLASDLAENVTGCIFRAGSGKFGIYTHPSETRTIQKDWRRKGPWTFDELKKLMPASLLWDGTKAPFIPD